MSEFDQTDDIEPEDRPDPEEFEGTEPGADSEDTGTHYDELGEAEMTPHDLDIADDGVEE
jgi:hypothetical protein